MFDCQIEQYITIAGLCLIFIYITVEAIKRSISNQTQREQEELFQLRLRYNRNAIREDQEIARMHQLEARYSLKEKPNV